MKCSFSQIISIFQGPAPITPGMMDNIRVRYLEGVEKVLVDPARIQAAIKGAAEFL